MNDEDMPSTQGPWLTIVMGLVFWGAIYSLASSAAEQVGRVGTAKAKTGVLLLSPLANAIGTKGAVICGLLTVVAGVIWLRKRGALRTEYVAQQQRARRMEQRRHRETANKASERFGE